MNCLKDSLSIKSVASARFVRPGNKRMAGPRKGRAQSQTIRAAWVSQSLRQAAAIHDESGDGVATTAAGQGIRGAAL